MLTSAPLKLLLIEDDEDDYLITRDLLEDVVDLDVRLEWVSSYEMGLQEGLQGQHDVLMIDYRLGGESGLDLIGELTCQGVKTPMILLTGLGDVELDQHAIEFGASDYLVKGEVTGAMLARSLRYAIDRERVHQQLIDSEQLYRLLFDANPESMWVVDRHTLRFLAVNQALVQLLGYTHEELLSMSALDLCAASEREQFQAFLPSLSETRDAGYMGLWTYLNKQGGQVQAETHAHRFEYRGNSAYLVLAVDVSAKVEAELALEHKTAAMRQLLMDNRDALLVVDTAAEMHFANPAALRMLQLHEGPPNPPLSIPLDGNLLFEWRLTLPDGSSVDVEVQRSATEWGGAPMHLLALRDITKRKKSDEQLRLLSRALECSNNGVLISNALEQDTPIIYANRAFERITGYSVAEVIGRNCRFLQGQDTEQEEVAQIRLAITALHDVRVEFINYRKDGSPFWNQLYIAPVPDDTGAVSHFIGVQSDITEQKRYEQELAYNASHDSLTGLPNRTIFEDRLYQSCELCLRHGYKMGVFFVDLDEFKPINDSLGHTVGDQVLIQVARRLERAVRSSDTVARMGGDEFIVLLPDLVREEDAATVAESILTQLAKPFNIEGHRLQLSASIGITLSDGSLSDPLQMIQQADLAMYRVKQSGRNDYQWYTESLNQNLLKRLQLRADLQRAIERGEFEVYYQPQPQESAEQLDGMEALLRWHHPEKGLVPPDEFIPMAESTGQIIALSEWVLATACRDACRLQALGKERTVAVNVSPMHFQKSGFISTVERILTESGLTPSLLELEVTEGLLLEKTEQAIETLTALRALGLSIALDDFGTGYSNLSYLKRLPIDKIKIDKAFVRDVIDDTRDAAIVHSIIGMAHNLGMKVLAEGVETPQQYAFLREHGCDGYQGYLFARPMPFERFTAWLNEQL